MARLLSPWSGRQITDANGVPVPGIRAYHYAAGTTSDLTVYTAATGGSAHAQPVVGDAGGYLPLIYIPEQSWKVEFRQPPPDEFTLGALVLGPYDNLQGGVADLVAASYSKPETPWTSVSISTTLVAADAGEAYAATPGSGTLVFTLPSATDAGNGRPLRFKKIGAVGRVRLTATGGQNIDGATSYDFCGELDLVEIASDGANWLVTLRPSHPPGRIVAQSDQETLIGYVLADGTTLSRTGYPGLFERYVKSATVTVTIASPGVVTWTGHGRQANDTVKFLTTGALPTGLTAGTVYFVVGSSITTNTFTVSATEGGAAINTSGSQSGVQTAIHAPHNDGNGDGDGSSTFHKPDYRGVSLRGLDRGRGLDANRAFGKYQADELKSHAHTGVPERNSVASRGAGGANYDLLVGGSTDLTGGVETRGKNTSAIYWIKV